MRKKHFAACATCTYAKDTDQTLDKLRNNLFWEVKI